MDVTSHDALVCGRDDEIGSGRYGVPCGSCWHINLNLGTSGCVPTAKARSWASKQPPQTIDYRQSTHHCQPAVHGRTRSNANWVTRRSVTRLASAHVDPELPVELEPSQRPLPKALRPHTHRFSNVLRTILLRQRWFWATPSRRFGDLPQSPGDGSVRDRSQRCTRTASPRCPI